MPVPTYVAVVCPRPMPSRARRTGPIALLYDKPSRDGIGITTDQFGENFPLVPAEREVT
jgi:hypothetical protein